MEKIKELFMRVIAYNEALYTEKCRELFAFTHNGVTYKLKPMFIEKYSKAYSMGLDDLEEGLENPQVNISIYDENEILTNIDVSFEDFKAFFRAVKIAIRPVEKIYQTMLAEFTELQLQAVSDPSAVITRLEEIIISNPYN